MLKKILGSCLKSLEFQGCKKSKVFPSAHNVVECEMICFHKSEQRNRENIQTLFFRGKDEEVVRSKLFINDTLIPTNTKRKVSIFLGD